METVERFFEWLALALLHDPGTFFFWLCVVLAPLLALAAYHSLKLLREMDAKPRRRTVSRAALVLGAAVRCGRDSRRWRGDGGLLEASVRVAVRVFVQHDESGSDSGGSSSEAGRASKGAARRRVTGAR
jgi:hypothetical protein